MNKKKVRSDFDVNKYIDFIVKDITVLDYKSIYSSIRKLVLDMNQSVFRFKS